MTGGPTYTPRPTKTPGPPVTLYVRESGNDENPGTEPGLALRTLTAAMKKMSPGSTLYVGRGVYKERLTVTNIVGTAALPVKILADPTGAQTSGGVGDVIIDGNAGLVAAIVTNSPYVTIDGFIIRGVAPTDDGQRRRRARARRSDHDTISNCVIANAQPADGIRVDSSSDVLLFNNLVFSADRGIVLTGGANHAEIVNTTVALSDRAALSIRTSRDVSPAGTKVTNCIFQENGSGAAIDATGAGGGWDGDFNLVFQPALEDQTVAYNPPTLRGDHDHNTDALFVNINVGDVHLESNSPAIDAGSGRIDDALKTSLDARTTTADGARDRIAVGSRVSLPSLSEERERQKAKGTKSKVLSA